MSLALYRRYRPETFAEVIGQEHVTEPLQQAIRNDRVHHAYLFSGPRGCGKTTSARLLARCLNCEKGPTPEPCGECQSCQDLSRNGGGSIDVVEIDAASHGGVDDARDLRERAFFAPAISRHKVYIIDEAHMVTQAGFNALLKVVEEPPPHLKFIFATTEPDKVIATIRSRTHHYPFRLVPPGVMRDYLTDLCAREGVAVEQAVLPLVVRAGAGSVRDALSILDQLIAGAGDDGVTYQLATALLGFTDAQLLDDVVDALAARDGAGVFSMIERVIESGHDPRRFAQDLLERLRDLVILATVSDAGTQALIDVPADQLERMRQQADNIGPAELTRAADVVNTGLTEMRGATAPRLQLELICARILLPRAYGDEQAITARLERLERRLGMGEEPPPGRPEPVTEDRAAQASPSSTPEASDARPTTARPERPLAPSVSSPPPAPGRPPAPAPPPGPPPPGLDLAGVRRMWPDILEAVKAKRRFTWMTLLDHVHVAGVGDGVLTLAFGNEGPRKNFMSSGSEEIVRQAVAETLGGAWRIDAVLDPGTAQSGERPPPAGSGRTGGRTGNRGPSPAGPGQDAPAETAPESTDPPPARPANRAASAGSSGANAASTSTRRPTAPTRRPARSAKASESSGRAPGTASPDDAAALDDPEAEHSELTGPELVARELGATVIDEYEHEGR